MRFQDRVALITAGGAGIGRATGDIMAREGGTVVAIDIDESRLQDMAATLADVPGEVDFVLVAVPAPGVNDVIRQAVAI